MYKTKKDWLKKGRTLKVGMYPKGTTNSGEALYTKKQTTKKQNTKKQEIVNNSTPDSWYLGDEYDYN